LLALVFHGCDLYRSGLYRNSYRVDTVGVRVGRGREEWGIANRFNRNRHFARVEAMGLSCDRPPSNLFSNNQDRTSKRTCRSHPDRQKTAGVFLDTLSALAYKEIKKNSEFVLPGFGKLVKQKRKARTGFPLLFYELPKSRYDELAVFFGSFVGDGAERIQEYTAGLFIRLRGFGKCGLKF
jgi:hypothetical protein